MIRQVPTNHRGELSLAHLAPERALRRLELTIVRRLEGFLHGEHLGLLPGPGTELAEARVYRPGEDDVRRMDWSVTARTTTPHVRDVISDRELETWTLVDMSASMDFGTAALEKRELAVAAVGTVGFLTHRLGDRFGGVVLRGGRVRRWPARSGRLALYGLLRSLLTEPRTAVHEADDDFSSALDRFSRTNPRRGLRVVVSDFLDGSGDDPGAPLAWERPMRLLCARHQVLVVEVLDPRELEIPDVGVVWLTDPETGDVQEVNTGDVTLRAKYAEAAAAHRARVRTALRRSGAAHLTLRTDRDWVSDTARFVLGHRRVAQRLHAPPARGAGV
ncbi:DUF58 domain-containing protein [Actinopolymorpha rutila]|uniref:Uncharacterized protein (DUF58 family) n=1 Tax=Actinopolymorpha rutila TaxID=446787 RepID=A0A852ZEU0_9ACTN|nr:uncharacterized protein (DUF58 family) [Actinopolymorpha rutila]